MTDYSKFDNLGLRYKFVNFAPISVTKKPESSMSILPLHPWMKRWTDYSKVDNLASNVSNVPESGLDCLTCAMFGPGRVYYMCHVRSLSSNSIALGTIPAVFALMLTGVYRAPSMPA